MIKRALISVSDKRGVVEFAKKLAGMGVEIISTGGTSKVLTENGIKVIPISDITDFPECLDGRVKTLHPAVHGGILAMRDNENHRRQLEELNITPIDLVAINLYPFKETISKENVTLEEAIENIDIGGPTMLRSAAKNHKDVAVVCNPDDYTSIIEELEKNEEVSYDTKYRLALKVFEHTAHYDALIANYLRKQINGEMPEVLTMTYEKVQDLRYGENPHQKAVFYKEMGENKGSLVEAKKLHGKELSFNNINDTNGALELLKEYTEPTVVAVKHTNACGVGTGYDIYDAYLKAYKCDPVSIFGGIIAANRTIDKRTAKEINKIFVEIVIAPAFEEEALEILKSKKNIRILELPHITQKQSVDAIDMKKVNGGLLIQEIDHKLYGEEELKVVTERIPTKKEMEDLTFAWKIVKHIKSNGIVLAKDGQTIGIGPGQVNRIWAVENAMKQSNVSVKGSVMASDAFFPFSDCVEAAAKKGITAIIQPGGSIRDQESIDMANKYGIAMVFTGMRHFKH
ncbi:bifunctional phosphoribosylaminoimidazolecarboxamide formyltransferase/IMP cyclohydrolase [Crassaminicella profunda]|uniref:bifunctional phosphoribosylaminoimidazolecarboxamide formyltransferase/IMP cyclohydrolase n=1 Tax=Crassaminicella profunda TaxID=1286698 RepID=UPI001CA6016F|nr:bifunctional phosphoribosylaminoimidazolecarboxamide formyltransferase/IMP cyclohydrolase [Crassaminicella profunda]QZY55719.1 bifunctional phosphoribosylaminoimidazolecarboxamide formyltransferase/IMP cyclohydrolase [Crassaminicella profunda]